MPPDGAIGNADVASRPRAGGSRAAPPGSAAEVARTVRREGCARRRRDPRRARRATPSSSVPVRIPPAGAGGDGEPRRWWRRIPFGLVLTVLLGALVLYAAFSQGEDPFSGDHHVSFRFL